MSETIGREQARQRLLEAAGRLFYSRGVCATGINAITAEAGVAKMSLYNNFASKEDLVLAYVEARHDELLVLYRTRCKGLTDPIARVLAMFDAYLDHASMDYVGGFRGCGLLNVAAEMPAQDAGRAMIAGHKAEIEELLRVQLEAAGKKDSEEVAVHLSFLLEGSMSRAGLAGATQMLRQARTLAEQAVKQR